MKTLEELLSKGYTLAEAPEIGQTITSKQVVFYETDGYLEGYLEARPCSKRYGGFYRFDENGDHENSHEQKYFVSNIVLNKPVRAPRAKQTDISKMKEIKVEFETAKAYAVYDGSNGCITRGNRKDFYKFYAKSICVEKDGKVYAPVWA